MKLIIMIIIIIFFGGLIKLNSLMLVESAFSFYEAVNHLRGRLVALLILRLVSCTCFQSDSFFFFFFFVYLVFWLFSLTKIQKSLSFPPSFPFILSCICLLLFLVQVLYAPLRLLYASAQFKQVWNVQVTALEALNSCKYAQSICADTSCSAFIIIDYIIVYEYWSALFSFSI